MKLIDLEAVTIIDSQVATVAVNLGREMIGLMPIYRPEAHTVLELHRTDHGVTRDRLYQIY